MKDNSRPAIDRRSKIYRMARNRNNKVLLTTMIPLIIAVICTSWNNRHREM